MEMTCRLSRGNGSEKLRKDASRPTGWPVPDQLEAVGAVALTAGEDLRAQFLVPIDHKRQGQVEHFLSEEP